MDVKKISKRYPLALIAILLIGIVASALIYSAESPTGYLFKWSFKWTKKTITEQEQAIKPTLVKPVKPGIYIVPSNELSVTHSPKITGSANLTTITARLLNTNPARVSSIKIYLGDTLVKTCASTIICTHSATNLDVGNHDYYATASLKEIATYVESFKIIDNTPPTIFISKQIKSIKKGQRTTLSIVNATDNAKVARINYYRTDKIVYPPHADIFHLKKSCIATSTIDCDSLSAVVSEFTESGNYNYYFSATDTSGNAEQTPVQTFTVTEEGVDITPPSISVSHSPADPLIGQTITIGASATDNVGIMYFLIYVDDFTPKNWVKKCTKSPCFYSTSYSTPGTHNYYVLALDTSGNSAQTPTKSFTVSLPDTTPPSISVSGPTDTVGLGQVEIRASASDNIAVSKIYVYLDPINLSAPNKTCIINAIYGNCKIFPYYFTAGNHTYNARAYDKSGNYAFSPFYSFEVK